MASKFKTKYDELGNVDDARPGSGKKTSFETELKKRAEWLLENDPDVEDLAGARKKARTELEDVRQWEKEIRSGDRDPESGELTRQGKKRARRRTSARRRPAGARARTATRSRSNRSRPRASRFVRDTARAVARPYGSVASAAWTLVTGALSIVILYLLLQREGVEASDAFVNGIVGGFRRFVDPYTPLIPTKGESATPGTRRVRLNAAAHRVVRHQPIDPWAQSAIRAGRRT